MFALGVVELVNINQEKCLLTGSRVGLGWGGARLGGNSQVETLTVASSRRRRRRWRFPTFKAAGRPDSQELGRCTGSALG